MQERRVRLFKNGQNQAVRIPREWELLGEEAIMRKDGERLIIEPVAARSLLALLDSWEDTSRRREVLYVSKCADFRFCKAEKHTHGRA